MEAFALDGGEIGAQFGQELPGGAAGPADEGGEEDDGQSEADEA